MKLNKFFKAYFLTAFLMLVSVHISSQIVEKVLFVKPAPVKMKIEDSYTFTVGYVAMEDRDIGIDLSGGPDKFWSGKTIKVSKGQGVLQVQLNPPTKPTEGDGYRLVLALRERGGNWKTTKVGCVISNIEFVNDNFRFAENASFSPLTPNVIESAESYNFDIDYSFSNEQFIQVSMWNGNNWLVSSQRIKMQPGSGTQPINLVYGNVLEGNTFKLMVSFGSQSDFDNKTVKSKELSGITFKKAEKKLTIKEINEKSIQISLNKESEILTLPGDSSFEFIRIIAMNGQIVLETANTNSIKISALPQGAYFAVTSKGDYYKFVKF